MDTVDTVQVLASVWNDTDLHGDHLRMLKSWDLKVVRGRQIWSKDGKNLSCSKLPEMAKTFIENIC